MPAVSAVDEVVLVGRGSLPPDTPLDTRGWARPEWRDGRVVLAVERVAGGTVVPFREALSAGVLRGPRLSGALGSPPVVGGGATVSDPLPAGLRSALAELARTPHLLVATDFDGVLAPIVDDPSLSAPLPASVEELTALAELPAISVAAVSGRALADLERLSGLPGTVHLVGSHGAEFQAGVVPGLDPAATERRARLLAELERLVAGLPGVRLEAKPVSVTVHVRRAAPDVGARALAAARSGPGTWDGIEVTEGKQVVELAVVRTDKGLALDVLRDRVGATAAVYLGDDVTDEKAFARLRDGDVGIKVGPGDTRAAHRIDTPQDATAVLRSLRSLRR